MDLGIRTGYRLQVTGYRRDLFPNPCYLLAVTCYLYLLWAWLALSSSALNSDEPLTYSQARYIMGTIFTITLRELESPRGHQAMRNAFEEIERIDSIMSNYKEDSELSQINDSKARGPFSISEELMEVLKASLHYAQASEGAFDVTVEPLMSLWGFKEGKLHIPSQQELKEVMPLVNFRHILLDEAGRSFSLKTPGVRLDLGGIAKGYALDRALRVLEKEGIKEALLDAGGNLLARGRWEAGMRNPRETESIMATMPIEDEAISTSGDYEKFFIMDGKRYCHILDPRKGTPIEGMMSVTVIAPTAMEADALSTAAFVMGPEKGMTLMEKFPEGAALWVTGQSKDGKEGLKVTITKGLKEHGELQFYPALTGEEGNLDSL